MQPDRRFCQGQGDGPRDHWPAGGDGGRRSRAAYAIIAWSSPRPRSIASRSATSRPITSSGISCTPLLAGDRGSATTKEPQHEIRRRISRPRQGANALVREIEGLVGAHGSRANAARSRSWKCAAGTRTRSSATASKACCPMHRIGAWARLSGLRSADGPRRRLRRDRRTRRR